MRCFGAEPTHAACAARTSGVSLLEALLASALGALLLVALLNLYQRGFTMHLFAESRAELAETLLTAEHILADELHLAGGSPCDPGDARFNLVDSGAAMPWLRLFTEPVRIADGGVSGSDELTVLKTGAPVPLAGHDPVRAEFALTHAAGFKRGGLAVVCDDSVSVLLQITRTASAGHILGYDHDARVRPGNCVSPFASAGCGPENHRFTSDALIAPYEPVVFFISDSDTRRSLYRRRLVIVNAAGSVTARLQSEEIIEGIALLHARAGAEDASGRVRLTRDPAGARRVVMLDVGLVAVARERNADTLPDEPLHLFGKAVGDALPGDAAAANRLMTGHEFSVAL